MVVAEFWGKVAKTHAVIYEFSIASLEEAYDTHCCVGGLRVGR